MQLSARLPDNAWVCFDEATGASTSAGFLEARPTPLRKHMHMSGQSSRPHSIEQPLHCETAG
eukprot:CAMPEP_0170431078 /NCGR_PEP_ID=MMETSP0117_2-20130122/41206_1 /TAXON_ID=400756 /ORGANISM="Durinskia baltica, Strain CSIRO CS-38" /LENGTH=61 /DNA_ID=CAMNT_0010690603 /DNA_START=101 /DNA_END=283 /DNA_ORIENTATION=+